MSALASMQPVIGCLVVGLALALYVASAAAWSLFWTGVIRNRDQRERFRYFHPSNRINRETESEEK